MPEASDLCYLSASRLRDMIARREISSHELVSACLDRIDQVNPMVNAVCTLDAEGALAAARAADERGGSGRLHGLPVAVKDLVLTAGMRTTFGSPIYRDFVPDVDALHVARMREAGAIVIGKTNTPEFGAGSQTFNAVFGVTRNPYDLDRTCGGSSGGAASALASGMLPIADGSDLGGSLRNPASFCNVVGFRPSPGRVPKWPALLGWDSMAVDGAMGRSVEDAALLLSAIAGPDARAPVSIDEPGERLGGPLERELAGVRIAWSPDLGRYPVDSQVLDVCRGALSTFEALGCHVEEATPDLDGADEVFQTLRAYAFAATRRADYEAHRDKMKDTVIWNIEQGLALSAEDVARAELTRTEIFQRMHRFSERFEFLICPVAQVLPFSVDTPWVREINGEAMQTYIDWMGMCYAITVTSRPAISVPCGFSAEGLPVGLQIVGRHRADRAVLELAHAFEQATRHGERRPAL